MLLTGGYLYNVYYSAFLIGPYVVLLLIPAARNSFWGRDTSLDIKRYSGTILVAFALPLIVCAPYLAKVSRLLSQTTDRGGNNFAYSTAHEFTLLDHVGSLIFPPMAQAEGWYYFGLVSLLLVRLTLARRRSSKALGHKA